MKIIPEQTIILEEKIINTCGECPNNKLKIEVIDFYVCKLTDQPIDIQQMNSGFPEFCPLDDI